jgi:hypothetical protein
MVSLDRGLVFVGRKLCFQSRPALANIGTFELEERELEVDEDTIAALNGVSASFAERRIHARD